MCQSHKKFYITLLLLIICCNTCYALTSDRQQHILIQADNATIDRAKGINTLRGHVEIVQGSTHLVGNKVVLYTDKQDQLNYAIATGSLARYWTQPHENKAKVYAKAETIKYFPLRNRVELRGKAEVKQAGDVFSGPVITYNTLTEVVKSQASKAGRIVITLLPQHHKTS